MPLCDIVTLSKLEFPFNFTISAGVIILILFWFFNSLAFSTESRAPRNSFLRCTNVTSVFIFAKKILQSKAESPPPAITTFLFWRSWLTPWWFQTLLLNVPGPIDEIMYILMLIQLIGPTKVFMSFNILHKDYTKPYIKNTFIPSIKDKINTVLKFKKD